MKLALPLSLLGILLSSTLSAERHDKLTCEVVDDGDKIIQCTYSASRLEEERPVQFIWRSETTPHDDRERTLMVPALHGSVYDYRYYYGRALGKWDVTVNDLDGNPLATTSFVLP